mmetsp:Transcript_6007/g.9188  ORF Transcript_6007/g.9188 Transcript_6007/m.9188 type:complete len:443 (+) Transcript_6007:104-1432(+)|eukprot:scaffold6042_cov148-Skeletonema_dohrnii-CCMP3373.AAC.1
MDFDDHNSPSSHDGSGGGEENDTTEQNELFEHAPSVNQYLFGSHLRKLQDIIAVFSGLLADENEYDTNQSKDVLDEKYHKPLHEFIMSHFPIDAGFLRATCFDLFDRSMEDAMSALKAELIESFRGGSATEAEQSVFLAELWGEAFHVGDGSTSAAMITNDGTSNWQNPKQTLAIKDNNYGDVHSKNFLLHRNNKRLGWKLITSKENPERSQGVRRTINSRLLKETALLLTSPLMLSFKKFNWMLSCKLAKWTRLFVDGHIPYNEESDMAFNAQATVLSWLNTLHGTTLSPRWYRNDFGKIANDADMRFLFDIALAGIMGSDGSVGTRGQRVFKIYQSNSVYCEELANAMRIRYGVRPRVATKISKTLRWKPESTIHFNTADTEKLMLRAGSFDLNRPDQHVVLMLKVLLVNGNRNKPIKNVKRMIVLLDNLASYIKKSRPS